MDENVELVPLARAAVKVIQDYLESDGGHNVQSQRVKVAYMTLDLLFRLRYLDRYANPTEESIHGQPDEDGT